MRRKMLVAGAIAIALTFSAAVITAQDAARGGGGQGRGGAGGGRGPAAPPLVMTTTAFEDGGIIPAKFVGAMGVSPELKWTQVPMGNGARDFSGGTGPMVGWLLALGEQAARARPEPSTARRESAPFPLEGGRVGDGGGGG